MQMNCIPEIFCEEKKTAWIFVKIRLRATCSAFSTLINVAVSLSGNPFRITAVEEPRNPLVHLSVEWSDFAVHLSKF